MTAISHLRAVDYPRMPWKNGAGSTLEIARDAGDGLDGFGWRLSIADVGESGAFSRFDGYQRIISMIEGTGMCLTVDGQPSRDLRVLDAFAFSGDSAVDCRLLDGPIRDFNLIYSPARYHARLQWLRLDGDAQVLGSAPLWLVFSLADGLAVRLEGETVATLGYLDCLQVDSASAALKELRLDGQGACALIELQPLA
ncbi:HutD/Ves family protein [Pseudomonas indica]|uniref:HutD/Ves family protein n=1 Tax=Pseudomonas indica TaxID=137658 RepID=UPI003FD694CD